MQHVSSWGRLARVPHDVTRPAFLDEAQGAAKAGEGAHLCFGMGRSYGDVCLNQNGRLIVTDMLDRIVASNYDVLARRIRVPTWEKLWVLGRSLIP